MNRWIGPACCISLVMLGINDPAAFPQSLLTIQSENPPLPSTVPLAPIETIPPAPNRWGGPLGADFLLGLPTGVRVQKFLSSDEDRSLVLEGFAGLFVFIPALGTGARWHSLSWCGESDALTLSPGLDAYLLFNPFYHGVGFLSGGRANAGLVAADVDCAWRHRYGEHFSGEFGLKLGAAIGFAARTTGALPLGSLYIGLRY
jgi:hypothetical protein